MELFEGEDNQTNNKNVSKHFPYSPKKVRIYYDFNILLKKNTNINKQVFKKHSNPIKFENINDVNVLTISRLNE